MAKVCSVHIAVYEYLVGPVPKGMLVCHSCDNRACINPEHLFLGTNMDNLLDASSKGRCFGGGKRQMPPQDKIKLLALAAAKEPYASIAKQFGISASRVSQIARYNGITYRGSIK